MKIGIFYFSLKPGPDRVALTCGNRLVYVRAAAVNARDVGTALDRARPAPDESVMNTHALEG